MKEKYNLIFKKLLKFFKIESITGGLEISDSWIRYVYLKDNEWNLIGFLIPQGVVVNGQIKNYELFVKILYELRKKIFNGHDSKKILNVVVSLNSIDIYSQIFTLPIIEGANLEKAIKLNIKMLSPQEESKTYSSWQIINRDQKLMRLEILSAFINKDIINDFKKAFYEAKFMPRSIESYSFSLVRFFSKKVKNFDLNKNYLIVNIDDSGIKSLIVRNGSLYFNYFSPWTEITKNEKQILWDNFEVGLIRHIHQVFNFYNSRWADQIDGLFLLSSVFNKEIKNIINQNFPFPVLEIDLDFTGKIPLEWYVAIGAYLRSEIRTKDDNELNLLGSDASELFIKNQVIQFIKFWRVVLSSAVSLIILVFFISNIFLNNIINSLKLESANINLDKQASEVKIFNQKISQFNNIVDLIKKVNSNYLFKYNIIKKINEKINNNSINLKNLSFDNQNLLIKILATSENEENISKFKKDLEGDSFFRNINLPFSEIKAHENGKVFSISFSINPSKIE